MHQSSGAGTVCCSQELWEEVPTSAPQVWPQSPPDPPIVQGQPGERSERIREALSSELCGRLTFPSRDLEMCLIGEKLTPLFLPLLLRS